MLSRIKVESLLGNRKRDRTSPLGSPIHIQDTGKRYVHRIRDYYRQSPAFKTFLVYASFFAYLFLGSGVFYAVESGLTPEFDIEPRLRDSAYSCLGNYNFWGSLFYAMSACSTIAFGQLHCCTMTGRIITLFYCAFGIPFILYVLANAGDKFCAVLVKIYAITKRFVGKRLKPYFHRKFANITNSHRKIPTNQNGGLKFVTVDQPMSEPQSLNAIDQQNNNVIFNWSTDKLMYIDDDGTCSYLDDDPSTKRTEQGATDPVTEIEEEQEDDNSPDFPMSLCIFLLVAVVLIIMVHIHDFEYVTYRYAWYYSLLFFIMQDYEVRDFRNTLPTYTLLLVALGIVSTTINAIIYNIHNLTNRIQKKLPAEIRKRKEALAAAGFPDAEVDAEQVLAELLASEGGFLARNAMPASTVARLETVCENTVKEVEREIEEEKIVAAAAAQDLLKLETVDTGMNTEDVKISGVDFVDKLCGSDKQLVQLEECEIQTNPAPDYCSILTQVDFLPLSDSADAAVEAQPEMSQSDVSTSDLTLVNQAYTNTDVIESKNQQISTEDLIQKLDQLIQCVVQTVTVNTNTAIHETIDKAINCIVEVANASCDSRINDLQQTGVQCVPLVKEFSTQVKPETSDFGEFIAPDMRTIKMQFPSPPPSMWWPIRLTAKKGVPTSQTAGEASTSGVKGSLESLKHSLSPPSAVRGVGAPKITRSGSTTANIPTHRSTVASGRRRTIMSSNVGTTDSSRQKLTLGDSGARSDSNESILSVDSTPISRLRQKSDPFTLKRGLGPPTNMPQSKSTQKLSSTESTPKYSVEVRSSMSESGSEVGFNDNDDEVEIF